MATTSESYVSVNGFRERQTPLIRELRNIIERKDLHIERLNKKIKILEDEVMDENTVIDLSDFLKDIKG